MARGRWIGAWLALMPLASAFTAPALPGSGPIPHAFLEGVASWGFQEATPWLPGVCRKPRRGFLGFQEATAPSRVASEASPRVLRSHAVRGFQM